MKLYLYFLLALSLLTVYACDPIFTGYWYLENQLDENIIVTRSDSTEISDVHIQAGDKGCIFISGRLGGAPFHLFKDSFSSTYNSDTLVIMNENRDTLFRLHPQNYRDSLNRQFWDAECWEYNVDSKEQTVFWFFTLENQFIM